MKQAPVTPTHPFAVKKNTHACSTVEGTFGVAHLATLFLSLFTAL